AAINKGFKRATGEVVAWLNSDDVYHPGALQANARYSVKLPETDMLYGDLRLMDHRGRSSRVVSAPQFDPVQLVVSNYILQPSVFIRRRVFDRIGYLDASLHYIMDYDYWLRAAVGGLRIDRVPLCSASFRQHVSSKSTADELKFWVETARVLDDLFGQPGLPAALRRVKRRAYARLHWNTAISLLEAGRLPEARLQSELAVDAYAIAQTPRDVDFAVDRVILLPDRSLLPPSDLDTRLSDLSTGSHQYSRLQKQVAERYDARRCVRAYPLVPTKDILLSLCRVALTDPRWLVSQAMQFVAGANAGESSAESQDHGHV
ncbi:glycosyltransferase, partial [Chloroflexota bacterium]